MFERCVLGVDPGVASTGLAAVSRNGRAVRVEWSDTVRTPSGLAEAERLRLISAAVRTAIGTLRPRSVAIERVMFGVNKLSALSVARATGVIMLAAAEAGVPVEEYVPLEVKLAIAGDGSADKAAIRRSLERAHRVEGVPRQADAADAVAVALCHLTQSRLRAAARVVGAR